MCVCLCLCTLAEEGKWKTFIIELFPCIFRRYFGTKDEQMLTSGTAAVIFAGDTYSCSFQFQLPETYSMECSHTRHLISLNPIIQSGLVLFPAFTDLFEAVFDS